jgi:carboxylesterase type B
MSGYWINFTRTGDANDGTPPDWSPFEAGHGSTMIFDRIVGTQPNPLHAVRGLIGEHSAPP